MKDNNPQKKPHVHEVHIEEGKLATLFLGIINTLEQAGSKPEEIVGAIEMAKLVWHSKHMHEAMKAHDEEENEEKKPIITPWTPPPNKPEDN